MIRTLAPTAQIPERGMHQSQIIPCITAHDTKVSIEGVLYVEKSRAFDQSVVCVLHPFEEGDES